AANDVWKTSIEYTGIDVSLDMLETGEKILAAMSANGKPIPNVAFKSFASHGSQAQKHDVVISAFALSELTTTALRRSTLEHLWDPTNDILILIDRGTPSGFKTLAEAREQILGLDLARLKPKPTYDTYGNLIPPKDQKQAMSWRLNIWNIWKRVPLPFVLTVMLPSLTYRFLALTRLA
ncbi:Methyltransferase-like protein 17, mitochondrial, partial [Lobosporangium transversale]